MKGTMYDAARFGVVRGVAWAVLAAIVVMVLVFGGAASAGDEKPKLKVADLPEHWRVWIEEEVYPLISKEQKRAFLRLETEAQRKAFVERLWILWDRQSGYGSNRCQVKQS